MELTINLPESVFEQLRTTAELTEQPLGELVLQSIAGNLPPTIDSAPPEIRATLLEMQSFGIEKLRSIAREQIPLNLQEQHLALLEKNQSGELTEAEKTTLTELTHAADQRMLRKAHACAILRWRGKPIRSMEQLSPV